jgi:NAD(P)-dependent dehydrogenase (short-subunit alcohol dehydrogenase family)
VADVDEGGGHETVAQIERGGGIGAYVQTDVRSRQQLEDMVAFAERTFGGLAILHANAGVGTPRPRFPDAAVDGWERTLAIDLWAVIACAQVAIPAMRHHGGGVIVNTARLPASPLTRPIRSMQPQNTA